MSFCEWALKRLKLLRDALASRLKTGARCGIGRLPSEVLAQILFLTIDFPFHDGRLPVVWEHDPLGHELMKFERVSKAWQECILSNPVLWSRVLIVADWRYDFRPISNYWARLQRQIRYAGQRHLDVCITMYRADNCLSYLPETVKQLLAPISHRIQSLRLFIPESMIRGLHPFRKSFLALKELYICPNNSSVPSLPRHELLDVFVEAPNLAFYETRGVADPSSVGIPWHRITRYSSSSSLKFTHFWRESRRVLEILSAAGSLQEAAFRDMVMGSPPAQIVSTSIVCARLQSLTLALPYYTGPHPIRQVLEHCTFPVLARLEVMTAPLEQYSHLGEYDWFKTFRALLRCIQRSHSPLCTLKFDNARVAASDVTELFRTVPTLEDVRLTRMCSGIDNPVIQSLCVQENGVIPLPRLRFLHLDGHLTFDLDLFVQMVKGRWDAAPLVSITLRWCGSVLAGTVLNHHQRQSLQQLRRQRESEVAVLVAELKVYESQGMRLQTGLNGWKY